MTDNEFTPVLENPPARIRGRGRKADPRHTVAAELAKENPGEWVKVGTFKSSLAASIKRGAHLSYPGNNWDATARSTHDGEEKTLYIRYLDS